MFPHTLTLYTWNACVIIPVDSEEHSKQMPAWIPGEGYLQKHSRSPPTHSVCVCAVSYQSGCRKWDPWEEMLSALPRIHSHHSFPYLRWDNRSPLTARGLNQTHSLSASLSLSLSPARSLTLSLSTGHFISDRGPQKGKRKKKKQSICSGSCLKFNKCVSSIATVWC